MNVGIEKCGYCHLTITPGASHICPGILNSTGLDPDMEIIEKQKLGEDIFSPGFMSVRVDEMVKMRDTLNEAIGKYDGSLELVRNVDETNGFGFYVDGYTLASTDKVGEIKLTSYDGRTRVVPSRGLAEWIERRLEN